MKNRLLTFCWLFIITAFYGSIFAQESINTLLSELNSKIAEVKTEKITYKQSFKVLNESKGKVQFTSVEENEKGVSAKTEYEFYLSDIDKNAVSQKFSGKKLYIPFLVNKKLNYIKCLKGEKVDSYVDNIQIFAFNSDDARVIIDKCNTLLSRSARNEKTWSSADDAFAWLKSNINEASDKPGFAEPPIKMTFDYVLGAGTKTTIKVEETDQKGKTTTSEFEFYMADLDANNIKFSVGSKKIVLVMGSANKQKLVKYIKNNEAQDYTNEIELPYLDVDATREITAAFIKAVNGSAFVPVKFNNITEAMRFVEDNATGLSINKDKYELSIDCDYTEPFLCNMKVTHINPIGATSEESYEAYAYTLDPATVKIESTGKYLAVISEVKGKKDVVKKLKGNQNSFKSEFEIMVADSKQAKEIADAMKYIIANAIPKEKVWTDKQTAINYVKETIGNLASRRKEVKQTLELVKNDPCSLKLTLNIADAKGNVYEEIYEVKLSDIDKSLVDFKTHTGNVYVYLICKNKQKLIKLTKNEVQTYCSELKIIDDDVNTGKTMVDAFRAVISKCE